MKTRMKWSALLLALALVLAACGGDDAGGDTETTAPSGDSDNTASSGDASGTIAISGSSTVEPISARVAQAFDAANGTATTVEGPGTGDGFAKFCNGETDISDASRAIKDEEAQVCADAGIEFVELHIATDGITVMTNPANEALSCLTFGDLYALIGPEAEGFESWSDANGLAAEVGGTGDFPDADLYLVGPGEESGTYDTFVELVIADFAEERSAEEATRVDYEASANDNVIIQGITENETSLGWVGFAFYEENADAVKAVALDDGESGCVEPTTESIATFEYPLSRPLFIYVNTSDLSEQTASFVDYYLSDEGIAFVSEAGYVELPAEDMDATRAAWESAKA